MFNHCNVVWHFYLSSRSSELLAKVDSLDDMLMFRDNLNGYIGLFDTVDIATASL